MTDESSTQAMYIPSLQGTAAKAYSSRDSRARHRAGGGFGRCRQVGGPAVQAARQFGATVMRLDVRKSLQEASVLR